MQERVAYGTTVASHPRDECSTAEDATTASAAVIHVRSLIQHDWPAVRRIHAEGINTGDATFETQPPEWDDFNTSTLTVGRLVAEDDRGTVHGWTALSPISTRPAYCGVVEDSIFVAEQSRHRGIGRQLLTALVDTARRAEVWTIQANIFPENTAAIGLHLTTGFRAVGRRHRIGQMAYGPLAGRWRDAILMEYRI